MSELLANNIKISVIVPIFNVDKYIEDCINSIITQTYENWELILVNDGSTDQSSKICEKFVSPKIKYFFQENKGVSSARNNGIKNSNGDYIVFVDGDDMLAKNALEIINNFAKKDFDIINFCWVNLFYDGKTTKETSLFRDHTIFSDIKEYYDQFIYTNSLGSACTKAIKSILIKNNKICFSEKMIFLEDQIFCVNLFEKASKIIFIKDSIYIYRIRKSGIIRNYKEQKICDIDNLLLFLLTFIKDWNFNLDRSKISCRFLDMFYHEFRLLIKLPRNDLKKNAEAIFASRTIEFLQKHDFKSFFKKKFLIAIKTKKIHRIKILIIIREIIAKLAGKRKDKKNYFV